MKNFNKRKKKIGLLIDKLLVSPIFFNKKNHQIINNKSIIIFDFHRIGDIVLLTALLISIRKKYKSYKITLVSGKCSQAILKNNPGIIDELIIFDAPWVTGNYSLSSIIKILKLIKNLKTKKYEYGIEVRGDLRQILLMHMCGVMKIVGFLFTGGKYLVTNPVPYNDSCKHLIDFHRQIASYLNCPIDNFVPKIWLSQTEKKKAAHYKSKQDIIIGIHPGASNKLKMLPQSTIIDVINKLSKKNWELLIFQGPQEKRYVDEIKQNTDAKISVINTDLRELIIHIASCSLVLSMDSACGHIATALNIPTVVIFGPAQEEFCKPIGNNVDIVKIDDVPCRPCNQKKCSHHHYHFCMKGISSVQIINKIICNLK